MLAEVFFGFWIYSAGFISGMLVFPCLAKAVLGLLQGRLKR